MIYLDAGIIVVCLAALALWAWHFPYPSPLIRFLLPPRRRWPEALIRKWLRDGGFDKGYLRYFYRDPERRVPNEPGLVAPADGLITALDTRDCVRYLVIALSFWDMHIQYCPLDGVVESIEDVGDEYLDGEGRDFAFLRGKFCPVQKRVVFSTPYGTIVVRLITSLAARRLEVWVKPGDQVRRGQRLGKILLGSTVVLEIPAHWPVLAHQGERVWAAQTLVAKATEPV